MFNLKTLLVERNIDCPMCGEEIVKGDVIYEDNDRGDKFCGYCADEYKESVILEEGEDGRLLK